MHLYPTEIEYKWAFGDLPEKMFDNIKKNPHMRDIFTEASPFEITGKEIKYSPFFKNKD